MSATDFLSAILMPPQMTSSSGTDTLPPRSGSSRIVVLFIRMGMV